MDNSTRSLAIKLPQGKTATFEEMQFYGETLQRFVRVQELQLDQVRDVQRHNAIIDYLQLLADGYNQQLSQFKIAEKQRHRALLVSMLRVVGG